MENNAPLDSRLFGVSAAEDAIEKLYRVVVQELECRVGNDVPLGVPQHPSEVVTVAASQLRQLASELRALGGAIREVSMLSMAFPARPPSPRISSFVVALGRSVGACHAPLQRLQTLVEKRTGPAGPGPGFDELFGSLRHLRDVLRAAASWEVGTELPELLCFSAALPEVSSANRAGAVAVAAPVPLLSQTDDDLPSSSSAQAAIAGIEYLCQPRFDRHPAEYAVERSLVMRRRMEAPEYDIAARCWPRDCREYWDVIKAHVIHLFEPEMRQNLTQACLEYARQRWPEVFGYEALSGTALARLTERLCDPALQSLQVAAVMGLAQLSRTLVTRGGLDATADGPFGPATICALLGHQSFLLESGADVWDVLDGDFDRRARATTISAVLSKEVSFPRTFKVKGRRVSVLRLALPVCLRLRDDAFFLYLPDLGAEVDDSFILRSLSPKAVIRPEEREVFCKIATGLLEYAMINILNSEPLMMTRLCSGVSKLIQAQGLDLSPPRADKTVDFLDEADFLWVTRWSVQALEAVALRRLAMDPRWDPNVSFDFDVPSEDDDDGDGAGGADVIGERYTTILHAAAGSTDVTSAVLRVLLQTKPDLEARDRTGNTPLTTAKTALAVKELVAAGCDTTARDDHGRNVWHHAAADNECAILECLVGLDPNRAANLRAADSDGNTPLACSLLLVKRIAGAGAGNPYRERSGPPVLPHAARMLLGLCRQERDPALYRSSESLLHVAAAHWAAGDLVLALLRAGADARAVDERGYTVLHSLTTTATRAVVRELQNAWPHAPATTPDGLTPAETILSTIPRSHPLPLGLLCGEAYGLLLTPAVLASRDAGGRGLWERFCKNGLLSGRGAGADHLLPSLCVAVDRLRHAGALRRYEEERGSCALLLLLEHLEVLAAGEGACRMVYEPFVRVIRESMYAGQFARSPAATRLLQLSLHSADADLTDVLLESGVSAFAALDGRTALEHALVSVPWNPALVSRLLATDTPDKAGLNAVDGSGRGVLHALVALPSPQADPEAGGGDRGRESRESRLRFLTARGAIPNMRSAEPGRPPLLVSYILDGHPDLAAALIDAGADVTLATDEGVDAIHATALAGDESLLRKIRGLVPPGFDWNRTCAHTFVLRREDQRSFPGFPVRAVGANPVHFASFGGRESVLKYLLHDLRMDPCVRVSGGGRQPVHFVALGALQPEACLRALVERGAEVNARADDGTTPLHDAVTARHTVALHDLMRRGARAMPDSRGLFPLHYALSTDPVLVRAFAFEQDKPAWQWPGSDVGGLPPGTRLNPRAARIMGMGFQWAVDAGDEERCKASLACLPPEALNSLTTACGSCTPLGAAVISQSRRNPAVVKLLLKSGFTGLDGMCTLHFRGLGIFSLLVEACRHGLGDAPSAAGASPDDGCFDMLLDACLRAKLLWPHMRFNAIHAAAAHCNLGAMQIIIVHLRKNAPAYRRWACPLGEGPAAGDGTFWTREECDAFVRRMVSQKAYLPDIGTGGDHAYSSGSTALHMVAGKPSRKAFRIAEVLLMNGAEADAADDRMSTPLHFAADAGAINMAKLLLQHGADPNQQSCESETPLMRAVTAGHLGMIRTLVRRGAWADIRASSGANLLGLAAERSGNPAVYQYLRGLGLDPYHRDMHRHNSVHRMILDPEFTAYVVNSDLDLAGLPDLDGGLVPAIIRLRASRVPSILERFLRRLPRRRARELANARGDGASNGLCCAVQRGDLGAIRVLLKHGADVNAEGCEYGSPLVTACALGRLEAAKLLVREGAALSYEVRTGDERGSDAGPSRRQREREGRYGGHAPRETGQKRTVVKRNAVLAARPFPELVRWILVDRFAETRCIGADDTDRREPVPWAGPWKAVLEIPGRRRREGETTLAEYVHKNKLARILRKYQVMPLHLAGIEDAGCRREQIRRAEGGVTGTRGGQKKQALSMKEWVMKCRPRPRGF